MSPLDWATWHEGYDTDPALIARLSAVRAQIVRCLDVAPAGSIDVISICAGDGRDLLRAVAGHPRAPDVRARLVEKNAELVTRGLEAAADAELGARIEFFAGDATAPASYQGFAPAGLVLAAGVFGNIRGDDTARLVGSLAWLCAPGGHVVWTRGLKRGGASHATRIRALFLEHGFQETTVLTVGGGAFLVATCLHMEALPGPPDPNRLFDFVGPRGDAGFGRLR